MEFIESFLNFLKNRVLSKSHLVPNSLCPNCWGREEYGGQFYNRIKQENLDVNSIDSNVGWVGAYANKHLRGIALKRTGNGQELVCEKCTTSYQSEG